MNFENFKKWPHFEEAEINAVSAILRSGKINRWTGGENARFEEALRKAAGVKHAIAVANGTLAIELALRGVGLNAGDEVIVPCRTFVATASAVVAQGGVPVVADVDLNTQNITAEAVVPLITPKTRGIIAVHHAGRPCDMDPIMALARSRGLFVIEDCAQAHGARYKDRPVGSIGDIGAWSFCQDKIITTGGEGGAVTTNADASYYTMWSYKDHGRDFDAVYNHPHPAGFRWLIESFGSNFRLTEMQAVLGTLGFEALPKWIEIRRRNAKIWDEALSGIPCVKIVPELENEFCAYYKYYFFINANRLKKGLTRDSVIDAVNALGIPAFSGTCWNISAEKCFEDMGWGKGEKELPNAFALKDTAVMLLTHPTITQEDMFAAAEKIRATLKGACS